MAVIFTETAGSYAHYDVKSSLLLHAPCRSFCVMPDSGQPKGKTPIKEAHRAARKFARTSVTNELKPHTVRKVRECGMSTAVRELLPGLTSSQACAKRRQVYRWVESADAIEQPVCTGKCGRQKTLDRGHAMVLLADAEEQLAFWINDFHKKGLPVSPRMLALQAREITTELEDSQQVTSTFSVVVCEAIIEHSIAAVYNADQTVTNYEYLSSHTISERGERTVWVCNSGVEKSHMTVMLLADSSGNKRPPFAVLKQRLSSVLEMQPINHKQRHSFGRSVWAEVSQMIEQTMNQTYCNGKGWWNGSLSIPFLKFHFGDRTNMSENILLMWEVRNYAASINVVLPETPAGYTPVC